MICLILAAGYATRMYPLTENFPKPLLNISEKPIIDWLIDDVEKSENISKYVVVSNHKFINMFNKWAEDSVNRNKIVVVDDGSTENENRLGAVKDIAFAIKELNINDDLIVLAGDNLLDFSLKGFINYFKNKNATCVMRYFEQSVDKLRKTGVVTIDNADKIVHMVEKPQNPESNWAVPPFYIYAKEDLSKINEGINAGCPIDAPGNFISWLCKVSDIYTYEMPGKRFDIGSIEGYENVKINYKGIKS